MEIAIDFQKIEEAERMTSGVIPHLQDAVKLFCSGNVAAIKSAAVALLLLGYTVYVGFAVAHSVDTATPLIVITAVVAVLATYSMVCNAFGDVVYAKCLGPVADFFHRNWPSLRWVLVPCLMVGALLYLCLDVVKSARQLQSLSGTAFFILFVFSFSKYPHRVRWRPVIWGFSLQYLMAILVLRWSVGYEAVKWLSDQITTFIFYSMAGSATVFGNPTMFLHPYVFVGLPMLIYMGSVLSICYYLGLTQFVASKMAWFVQLTMGTTAIESLGTTANIFLNGMDTMLMLKTYIVLLTPSEFHCFLVGQHATVAGFIFGLFVMFGAPPQHLLSAAVMSAPATIAIAKLSFPETYVSKTKNECDVQLSRGTDANLFEAAANGAAVAGKTVAAVIVNFIAFIGMLAFVNATLSWIGGNVGHPELSFELICSYLFWPLSVIMGVDIADCGEVGKLVGIKVFTSEVLAYQELGKSIRAGRLSERSSMIATYALCGFSGLSTLAIAVGVWNTVIPSRTRAMSEQMLRVITNANISCFMTACVAGLMHSQENFAEAGLALPDWIVHILGAIPGYKQIMDFVGL